MFERFVSGRISCRCCMSVSIFLSDLANCDSVCSLMGWVETYSARSIIVAISNANIAH